MLFILDPNKPNAPFPPVDQAETEPDGLLAVGGDLSSDRLLNAYKSGIFPWYSEEQPILWWSPNPRTVLFPEKIKVSRSLRKTMRKERFTISVDTAFKQVMDQCAAPRRKQQETWITRDMQQAYLDMHLSGYAHSIEVWNGGELVGGLYGIAIGQVFFGESMFSRSNDASKIALAFLCNMLISWNYKLIDCQVYSEHMTSLGAEEIPRSEFCDLLDKWCASMPDANAWHSNDETSNNVNRSEHVQG